MFTVFEAFRLLTHVKKNHQNWERKNRLFCEKNEHLLFGKYVQQEPDINVTYTGRPVGLSVTRLSMEREV